MKPAEELQAAPSWETCTAVAGCGGVRADGGDGGCLAHLGERGRARYLGRLSRGRALDARGVTLDDGLLRSTLASCPADPLGRPRLIAARFDGATFAGPVSFEAAVFERDARFDGAVFEGAANFQHAVFTGSARFARSVFRGEARFGGATLAANAWFAGATFESDSSFERASVRGLARFTRVRFAADVVFDEAIFASDATFDASEFACHARFTGAIFGAAASFNDATFANPASFDATVFKAKTIPDIVDVATIAWAGPPIAGWRPRLGAALLDHVAALAIVAGGLAVSGMLRAMEHTTLTAILLATFVAAAGWFLVRNLVEQGYTGQTFGKRRAHVRVVDAHDASAIGPGRSLVRYGLHALDVVPLGAGVVVALRHPRHQTFADRIMNTVVVVGGELAVAAREAAAAPVALATARAGFG